MAIQSERIEYIDYIKAFAIFMVIVGHSIQNLSTCNELNVVYSFIYSFHMPLFMTLSGFFIAKSFNSGIKQFFGLICKWEDKILVSCCFLVSLCHLTHNYAKNAFIVAASLR